MSVVPVGNLLNKLSMEILNMESYGILLQCSMAFIYTYTVTFACSFEFTHALIAHLHLKSETQYMSSFGCVFEIVKCSSCWVH